MQKAKHAARILRGAVVWPAQEVKVVDLPLWLRDVTPADRKMAEDVVLVVDLGDAAHADVPVVLGLVHLGPVAGTLCLSYTQTMEWYCRLG